jgi:hypothetical protein
LRCGFPKEGFATEVLLRLFIDALAQNDAQRICSLLSPDALSRLGGPDRCLRPEREAGRELRRGEGPARDDGQVNGSYYVDDLFNSTFTSGVEDGG